MMGALWKEHGFSLVETLIATFIFALVSASGVALLSGYQEGRLSLAHADERLADLEIARSLMRDDLLMAIDRPLRDELGGGLGGFAGGAFMPDNTILRFVRGGDVGALLQGGVSALKRVDYILEEDSLIRRTYARTDITPATESTDRILFEGVNDLELRFEAEGVWVDEWGAADQASSLPRLAEMTIRLENGRGVQFVFLVGGAA